MNIDEIIEQYTIESSIDTNIDRLNVTEVQEKLVNNKHKWSARLINHKIKLNKYRKVKYCGQIDYFLIHFQQNIFFHNLG